MRLLARPPRGVMLACLSAAKQRATVARRASVWTSTERTAASAEAGDFIAVSDSRTPAGVQSMHSSFQRLSPLATVARGVAAMRGEVAGCLTRNATSTAMVLSAGRFIAAATRSVLRYYAA